MTDGRSNGSAAIDAVLRTAVDRGAVAGCVATAGSREGTFYEGAFGRGDAIRDVPIRADTIFRIASMTKAITSVAVMQLVERGAISLDDPAARHTRELADVRVLEGIADDGTPVLREPASQLTIRQLLSHTAGFAYEMWNERIAKFHDKTDVPGILGGGSGFLGAPLVSDPGTRWEYSIATDWLGVLVERVSGVSLDQYLDEHVLLPLGMGDTAFFLDDAADKRLVSVQLRKRDGSLSQRPSGTPVRDGFCSGGGGLLSTASDYLRFTRALLRGGEFDGQRILEPETVFEMSRGQLGALAIEVLQTTDPRSSRDVDFFPGTPKTWGLGFLINEAPLEGRRAAGSLSWAGFHNSYFWIDPVSDVCGVLLMQQLPFFDEQAVSLLDDFERAVYSTAALRGNRGAGRKAGMR